MILAGMTFINEHSKKPIIDPSVIINGLVDCAEQITIEKDVFSGFDIMILTGSHDPNKFGVERTRSARPRPVHIKEGAWLCSRCIILGGVTIGRFAVVGAGAVVTKDVPDYALVVGSPARVVKYYNHEGQP